MNSIQHPLVDDYLNDLARMLHGLPADEQHEVLEGVREHIHAALSERSDVDVRSVLAELGPPDAVAREAYGSGPYAVPSPLPATPVKPRVADRHWVPVLVAVLQVLALGVLLAAMGGAAVYTTAEITSGGGATVRTVDYHVGTTLMLVIASTLLVLPLWIGTTLLVGNSRLWIARHRFVHILLLPMSALVVGLIPDLGWALAGERGLNIASLAGLVLVLVIDAWLILRLTRAGRTAATR